MNIPPEILAIQSDKKELIKVEQFLRLYFKSKNLPEYFFNKVFLCVSEAVINSIEHGNKMNNHKKVTIEASCVNNDLSIEVSDEGEGFNYNDVPDPTTTENIYNETGRGIFIMKSICNKLNFKDEGKCVEIKIELM
jgi:serine/threonine-protein kinase RsbW